MSTSQDLICIDQIFSDISAADLAALNLTTSQNFVQLGTGGDAILTLPVQDGLSFKVIVTGKIHSPGNYGGNVFLYLNGVQTSATTNTSSGVTDRAIYLETTIVWDSNSQTAHVFGSDISGNPYAGASLISSPSNFQFKLSGEISTTDPSATLTITQFRAKSN